ncbi:MAG: 3-hydroxyacyl-ACP dehydratase FabZ [Candidatus Omnitrophica bacterium]|nr:3-hydroxyacyl-ACP dehydratase FabZ [Candidatus Omnitrophota bacterium]
MSDKVLNVKQIMETIPHKYPFLLVDRVIDYEEGKWIKAIKNVTMNELFFQGHFPGEPIMPGVLIIEGLAQTGGILAMLDGKNKDKLAFFMTINNAKFRKPVTPGDQLFLDVNITKVLRETIIQAHGEASVDGKVVCEADLMFSVAAKT